MDDENIIFIMDEFGKLINEANKTKEEFDKYIDDLEERIKDFEDPIKKKERYDKLRVSCLRRTIRRCSSFPIKGTNKIKVFYRSK